jgi:hypothetical protein
MLSGVKWVLLNKFRIKPLSLNEFKQLRHAQDLVKVPLVANLTACLSKVPRLAQQSGGPKTATFPRAAL